MTNDKYGNMSTENTSLRRLKFGNYLNSSDPNISVSNHGNDDGARHRDSSASATSHWSNNDDSNTDSADDSTPYAMSPWHQPSPYNKSPWSTSVPSLYGGYLPHHGLIGSLVREEGHVYSLAAHGNLLYTGSDSKNVRVWKNLKEYSGFKSSSGLVKSIVIHGDKIFTGHQDGKIRVWKASLNRPSVHKRIGSLPKFKDMVKKSMNPKNYVEVRRHRNALRIRHFDAVSCLSLNEEQGLLYSGSWDKTVKCWRISDSKCLESINAHDDAVNSVVCGFDCLVFTGSADGKVKVWRRELQGKATKHFLVQVLLDQEFAVTSLAVNQFSAVVYCGSSDGLVNFWDKEKHLSHGGVMRGHKQAVLCVATAGNLVFTGSADKTICVWRRDASGGHTCLSVLTGHTGPVKCLAVEVDPNPSDKLEQRWILYSGSLDNSVKVWRVSDNAPSWHQVKAAADAEAEARGNSPGSVLGVRLSLSSPPQQGRWS